MRAACSNASFRPQFVTELQNAHLHKLKLPSEFMMQIEEEDKSRPIASVLSPLRRKPWMIGLIKDHSETFLKGGWHEFSKFHKLEPGFKLLFRYEGNMVFTVKVFDLNGCLKNYNRDAPAIFRRIDFNDSGDQDLSPEKSASVMEMEVPSSSRKRTKRKHDLVLEKKTAHHECSNSRVELRKASTSYVKKRIKNVVSTSPHTHEIRMSHYNIINFLSLPKTFGSIPPCNLEKGKITVKNEKQETWKVQFNTASKYNNLCGGWKVFCRKNGIQTGDKCTLKITAHNEILVSVSAVNEVVGESNA